MEQAATGAVTAAPSARPTLPVLFRALRPDEWIKNTFVFAAVLFSGEFDMTAALRSAGAFVAFCTVASAGYLVNDVHDVELDRRHPVKRERAIASGALPVPTARVLAAGLLVAGLGIGLAVAPAVCGLVAAYGALSLTYSFV